MTQTTFKPGQTVIIECLGNRRADVLKVAKNGQLFRRYYGSFMGRGAIDRSGYRAEVSIKEWWSPHLVRSA